MIASMYVPQAKLLQFQELVKLHNLRFQGNPLVSGERAYVCVSSEHLPPGAANGFFADWNRVTQPIVEVRSGGLTRLLRKLRGRWRNTLQA